MTDLDQERLKDVEQLPDGRLMAASFYLAVCDACMNAHFDLKANDDQVFATATIPPEEFRTLAAWFTEIANEYEAHAGKKLD